MLRLEKRNLEWFVKQGDDNNEIRNFFTSLHETTLCHKKVVFEAQLKTWWQMRLVHYKIKQLA